MFGYVKPFIPELKVYENEIYKAIYCGLCKQLGRSYNQLSRLMLSYDIVFLVLFALGISNEDIEFQRQHCIIHPLKKNLCLKNCRALENAADISLIFSYFKFFDNLEDERFLKKFVARVGLISFKRMYEKASKKRADIANIVEDLMHSQAEAEKNINCSLDRACDPISKCLGLIVQTFSDDLKTQKILYRIGYMVGRYIYIIDALDDLDKDCKTGSFNPFLIKYRSDGLITNLQIDDCMKKEIFQNALWALNFSVAQLAQAFELLEFGNYKSIVKNIIYLGLKSVEKKVFDKYKQKIDDLENINGFNFGG